MNSLDHLELMFNETEGKRIVLLIKHKIARHFDCKGSACSCI